MNPRREIRPGERVDGFRVGRLLHEGGMARLYRVTHPRHKLPLVMKVPRLGPEGPLSALVAFENELRLLERLHGAHVPRFVAAGDLPARPYLVMEYIEGATLAEAAARAPLAPEEIRRLMVPLCRAVHELHRHNVIHLDLNPRNVLYRKNGAAVLVDFGLAHHAALPDMNDTAFGEGEGTAPYIAPEQLHHVRSESRSDIYAIGAILYRLATGEYPFGRPNLLALKKRLFEPPPPPRWRRPEVAPWLQEIILKCLEIRPEQRYATAKQVAYALAHPENVHLTARAHRRRPAGAWTRLRLWFKSLYQVFEEEPLLRPYERIAGAPHVLVALDLAHASPALKEVLQQQVRKIARAEPHSTFTCLAVIAPEEAAPFAEGGRQSPEGVTVPIQVAQRQWAQPLRLPPDRIFFQVIPGLPAAAIVEYAARHGVDQIILGARGSGTLRRVLGSVSSKVVAQAPCTVTVVRSRRDVKLARA
jgi:serine/threonine protein kinase